VAEAHSFTQAARRLGLTTNAVSLRVAKLEECVGARLFVRTTRRVATTDEGDAFLERALRILAEYEAGKDELGARGGGLHGKRAIVTRPAGLSL
jgi:DNA-binding transcriptional LysR family regulator